MKNLKIKLVSGFRKDQEYTIDAEEAHKAYYLFLNPEQRGVFSTGLAIIGQDIRHIEPDYSAMMGWNQGYIPTPEDFNEIRANGVERKLKEALFQAKGIANQISQNGETSKLSLPLSEVILKLDGPMGTPTK